MFRGLKLPLSRRRDLSLRRRFQARLSLEPLESRTLLSVFTPTQIRHAYGIDQIAFNTSKGKVVGDGAGQTIAIVDAYFDPTIQSDLATFSQHYGLAPLDGLNGNGTFTQLDLSNGTLSPPNDDWTLETALDVEWAHAVAPKANIQLVEAASDHQDPVTAEPTDLLNAVHTAATTPGVSTVSMSWGLTEVPNETSWDSFFTTPGVTFVAASGDSGAGTIWPSVSPNVVSVGGTTLRLTASNTISSEKGWGNGIFSSFFGGSGGGFSQFEPLPSYQQNAGISSTLTQFGVRLNPDVAYDANPNTGFIVVNGGSGFAVGGTSAGAPQWAALVAIADQGRALNGEQPLDSTQTLNALYSLHTSTPKDFRDITQGSTGMYLVTDGNGNIVGTINVKAGTGFDMVTGLGTPVANKLVPDLANTSTPAAKTAAVATPTQSGGSTGSGNKSRPRDVPVTNGVTSVQTSLALSNLNSVQTTFLPATPSIATIVPSFVVSPALASSLGKVSSVSVGSLSALSGGGGGDLLDQTDAPADNQPVGPVAPVVPMAAPPVPMPPAPAPKTTDPASTAPNGLDAVFMRLDGIEVLTRDRELPALPFMDDERPTDSSPPVAALGLVVALVLHAREQHLQPEDHERRRLRV